MSDVITDLIDHLTGLASVKDLTTDNTGSVWIHGLELPKSRASGMPRAAVVLSLAGSASSGGFNALTEYRVDVFSYGETPYKALLLSRAVHAALKFSRRNQFDTARSLRAVSVESGPRGLRDQDTDWPVVIQTFLVTAEEETVIAA